MYEACHELFHESYASVQEGEEGRRVIGEGVVVAGIGGRW